MLARSGRLALVAALIVAVGARAGRVDAQVDESELRAADGTTYQVLRAASLGGGAARLVLTTVGGSIGGAGSCAATGNMSGDATSAIGGVLPPGATLHPYSQVHRTFVLTPNDIGTVTFNSSFGGRVTLGTGAGALNVCSNGFDCTVQPNVQPLVGLDSNMGTVPPACIATGLNAGCDGLNLRDTFAFGLAAAGNPPVCTTPANVTVNTTVCAGPPADGFSLNMGQAIVFVYNSSLATSGFAVATGGFGVSAGTTSVCGANQVVSATGDNDSQPAPPPPTPTPTNTPTNTATSTATRTNTATATNTATNTATATNTVTASATRTNTATATNTPPPTNTRPPIPVVPSPTSPAGLVMIIGLGGGLLWALRRLARVK